MCDCLVALPAATEGACTLFAKNSDRPPAERQVVHWSAPRRDLGVLRTTHIDVAAHEAVAIITALLERHGQGGSGHDPALSPNGRPYWNAFLDASVGTAFVIDTSGREWAAEPVGDVRAISNRTSIPGFDATHRHPRQPVTVAALQQHLRSHDTCGDPGWSVCMHVDGVEATTASMIVALQPGSSPLVWALTGSPCRREYRSFELGDAATIDFSDV